MDIKEFAQEFIENVKMSVEMTGSDYYQKLATSRPTHRNSISEDERAKPLCNCISRCRIGSITIKL